MTAVISWSTFCGHGTASLYLATDSRRSLQYPDGTLGFDRDDFQKTFASPTTPDIFAVCGKVGRLNSLVPRLFTAASEDRDAVGGTAAGDEFTQRLVGRISDAALYDGLILFHGYRFGVNDFGLNRVQFGRIPGFKKIPITPKNGLLYRDGSGEEMVRRAQLNDLETDGRGFSRWYWQSFVLSLNPSTDKSCGGAPQLVGLFQKGAGVSFGIRFNGRTYVNGSSVVGVRIFHVRDELFQRVTPEGNLFENAQPHARNFPRIRLFG
jgi:hypothetical protein